MAIIKVVLSLLKKQKAYSVTIFCLTAVVALMLSTALTVMKKSGEIHDSALENSSSPDIFMLFDDVDEYNDKLSEQFADMNIKEISAVGVLSKYTDLNGIEPGENIFYSVYEPDFYNFRFKYAKENSFSLKDGEVIFPLFYESYYSLNVGDTVKIAGENFRLADFYEDPMFGSSTIGMRRGFMTESALESIRNSQSMPVGTVYVYIDAELGDSGYSEELNRVARSIDRGESGYLFTVLEVKNYAMLISNLVSAVLFAFALVSLLITLYVLRYAVLSSIEGNFVTLGVFKAIGFTGGQIRSAIILQYALICLVGSNAGVIASVPVIPILGGLLLDSAGLFWQGGMWVLGSALVIIAAVILICVITWLNTRKIKKISPVRAIAFGRAPVYFAKRMNISLQKLSFLPLHARMALKQMLTRRKQYSALVIITVLLTFMTAFTGGVAQIFTDDKNVIYVFGFPNEDFSIGITNDGSAKSDETLERLDKIITEIESKYEVEKVYEQYAINTTIEGIIIRACVYETFEEIGLTEPLSGRFPKYDNELALSPVMASRFDKSVGDTVCLQNAVGEDIEYIITGIVQNMSDVGQNFSITSAGIKRAIPDLNIFVRSVILKENDGSDTETSVEQIKSEYNNGDVFVSVSQDWLGQMLESIQSVIAPATGISYGLAVVLIALITFLLAMIAIYRENTDIGIFKSTGFTSKQLRFQFALRFLSVSLTGGLIGLITTLVASNALVSFIFSFFGVPRVSMYFGLVDLLFPIVLICFIAVLASWVVSGRIKKISGRTLITE